MDTSCTDIPSSPSGHYSILLMNMNKNANQMGNQAKTVGTTGIQRCNTDDSAGTYTYLIADTISCNKCSTLLMSGVSYIKDSNLKYCKIMAYTQERRRSGKVIGWSEQGSMSFH